MLALIFTGRSGTAPPFILGTARGRQSVVANLRHAELVAGEPGSARPTAVANPRHAGLVPAAPTPTDVREGRVPPPARTHPASPG